MKLCKDCRHHGLRAHKGRSWAQQVCLRTQMTNSVTGEPFWRTCEQERTDSHRIRFFQSNCGSRGRFWESNTPHKDTVVTPTGFRWEGYSEDE